MGAECRASGSHGLTEFQLAFSTVSHEINYFTGVPEYFEQEPAPVEMEPGLYRVTPDGGLELITATPPTARGNDV
jgi:hypothetical protein